MDFATQMRRTYLSAVPHTVYTAAVWLTSGYVADSLSKAMAIVFFIAGCTFIFPFGELIRKIMKPINVLSAGNRLPRLFTLLAFTIPLSYPLIYMACVANINYFFPAFTILVGAHYLPFVWLRQIEFWHLVRLTGWYRNHRGLVFSKCVFFLCLRYGRHTNCFRGYSLLSN
ncbi:MAG: hypothetical protein AB7K37_14345 [Cyclobacteriaceae bacterium]